MEIPQKARFNYPKSYDCAEPVFDQRELVSHVATIGFANGTGQSPSK